ncbi:protein-lysine N-methyltransferase [Rhodotorula paludigena]|uniref:protein-lysine N-methyltransferase n=1 Tax=Rhodotorula paludigena TaxID=86838 RepID=UPI00317D6218
MRKAQPRAAQPLPSLSLRLLSFSRMQLADWLERHRVFLDPRLSLVSRADGSTAVDALAPIPPHSTVGRIPVSLVLSHRSSALASRLNGDPLASHTPALRLAVHVAHEVVLGPESRWQGYLATCPEVPVPVALLWRDDALDWVMGTELQRELSRIGMSRTRLQAFYDDVVLPIFSTSQSGPESSPTFSFAHLLRAYSLVSSRAFQVSSYHSLALVPLADAFNHSDPPHVHFASDTWVCPECGRLEACPHDEETVTAGAGALADGHEDGAEETLDMVSERAIEAGEEVYNTYGAGLANAKLAASYGFLLEGNEHDVLSFHHDEVIDVLSFCAIQGTAPELDPMLQQHRAFRDAVATQIDAVLAASASTSAPPSDHEHPLIAPPLSAGGNSLYFDADARLSPALWALIAVGALHAVRTLADERAAVDDIHDRHDSLTVADDQNAPDGSACDRIVRADLAHSTPSEARLSPPRKRPRGVNLPPSTWPTADELARLFDLVAARRDHADGQAAPELSDEENSVVQSTTSDWHTVLQVASPVEHRAADFAARAVHELCRRRRATQEEPEWDAVRLLDEADRRRRTPMPDSSATDPRSEPQREDDAEGRSSDTECALALEYLAGERLLLERVSSQWDL